MMRFGSGTYNVRESEGREPTPIQLHRSLVCTVFFLDNTQYDFELDVSLKCFLFIFADPTHMGVIHYSNVSSCGSSSIEYLN